MLNENRMTVEEEVVRINANTEVMTKKLSKHDMPACQGSKRKVNKFKPL